MRDDGVVSVSNSESECRRALPPIRVLQHSRAKRADPVKNIPRGKHVGGRTIHLFLDIASIIEGKDKFIRFCGRQETSIFYGNDYSPSCNVRIVEGLNAPFEPSRRGPAIRVDEGEHFATRNRDTCVARRSRALLRRRNNARNSVA